MEGVSSIRTLFRTSSGKKRVQALRFLSNMAKLDLFCLIKGEKKKTEAAEGSITV